MGRLYAFGATAVAVSAQQDIFEIVPADDKPVTLHSIHLSQHTEVGDPQEEQIRLLLYHMPPTFTSGSGGSSPTISPLDGHDPAASAVVEVFNTAQATTSGGAGPLWEESFNLRFGFVYIPDRRYRPRVYQGSALVLWTQGAPLDSVSFDLTVMFEED